MPARIRISFMREDCKIFEISWQLCYLRKQISLQYPTTVLVIAGRNGDAIENINSGGMPICFFLF